MHTGRARRLPHRRDVPVEHGDHHLRELLLQGGPSRRALHFVSLKIQSIPKFAFNVIDILFLFVNEKLCAS